VSVVIPDLDRFLGHIEGAGRLISPGAFLPGALKEKLAAQFGDPGLAGLGPGPVVGLLFQSAGGAPRVALLIPARVPAPYQAAFAKQSWKTRAENGVLAAAPSDDALEAAWGALGTYRAVAKGEPVAHDLRFEVQAGRLVATYGPLMELGLRSAMAARTAPPAPGAAPRPGVRPPSPEAQRLATLELKALLAVLSSTDGLRMDVDLEGGALSVATSLSLTPGSPLASLATMPMVGSNPARALVPGPGLMSSEWRIDPVKVSSFGSWLVDELAKEPDAADLVSPDMKAMVAELPRCSGGQMAYSLRTDESGAMIVDTAMTVSDENACLALSEKGLSLTTDPAGFLAKVYRDLGLSLTMRLEKGVRSHSGVPVHRLKTTVKPVAAAEVQTNEKGKTPGPAPKPSPSPSLPPALANPMLAAMLRDTEFAYTHGYVVSSQDPARVDALIDLASSGAPAPADVGPELLPGANMASSYDLAGVLKVVGKAMPDARGGPNVFADLPPSEPVRFALALSNGRVEGRWRMPLGSLGAIAQSAAAAARSTASPKPDAKKP
jgi:hypothetical protein